jgi:hypothetical protein
MGADGPPEDTSRRSASRATLAASASPESSASRTAAVSASTSAERGDVGSVPAIGGLPVSAGIALSTGAPPAAEPQETPRKQGNSACSIPGASTRSAFFDDAGAISSKTTRPGRDGV